MPQSSVSLYQQPKGLYLLCAMPFLKKLIKQEPINA
jgi:hypothetical protein